RGKNRRGRSVGADRRFLREEREPAASRHAACQGSDRAAAGLSHRHGRPPGRPELEAAAQPPDPGESAGHQPDPGRFRRALARRERPADRRGDGDEVAMNWKPAVIVLAAFVFAAQAHAQGSVPEPDGYRTDNYRAPVPATLAGVRVLTTAETEAIWRAGNG